MRLKRDVTKYIRDKAKSKYNIDTECYICGSQERIQFHHYNTITELVARWTRINKYDKLEVLSWREQFIEEHKKELYEETVTLCEECHVGKLHNLYGRNPSLGTAAKQKRWVEKQKECLTG